MRITMNDEKVSSKLSAADKKKIEDAISSTSRWLDSNQSAEKEEFEEKQKELERVVTPILQSLGGAAGGMGGGFPGGFPGAGAGGYPGGGSGFSAPSEAADEGPKIEEID